MTLDARLAASPRTLIRGRATSSRTSPPLNGFPPLGAARRHHCQFHGADHHSPMGDEQGSGGDLFSLSSLFVSRSRNILS
jgi:hypothetical protein